MLDSLTAGCKLLYPTEITITILSYCVTYQLLFDISLLSCYVTYDLP